MSIAVYTVYWDEVEGSAPEEYNEAFLASLREELKKAEGGTVNSAYIEPRFYSGKGDFWACAEKQTPELFEAFTAAMLHTARRLKDCTLIAGFVLPDFEKDWNSLIAEKDDEERECALYGDSFKQAFAKKYSHFEFISR